MITVDMRIEGPRKPDEITKTPSKEGVSKTGDTSFSNMVSGGAGSSSSVSAPTAPVAVGGIFMLQALSDEERKKRRQAITDRKDSLNALDQLVLAMVRNDVSTDHLLKLREQAQRESPSVNDPALTDILAQIDIRLAVEIAKLERIRDKS